MADDTGTDDDDFEAEFTFTWKIENFSYCLPWKWVRSPSFVVDSMNETKWCLHLWPKEYTNGIHIEYYLYREDEDKGPQIINVEFELSFLDVNGSPLTKKITTSSFENNDFKGFAEFVEQETVFKSRSSEYLPEDELTARCKLRRPGTHTRETVSCFAGSYIGVECSAFDWLVKNFSSLHPGDRWIMLVQNTLKDKPSVTLALSLTEKSNEEELQIEITHEHMNKPNMTSCEIALVDSFGNVVISKKDSKYLEGQIWKFPSFIKKSDLISADNSCLQNDTLTLRCDITISIGIISNDIFCYNYDSSETDDHFTDLSDVSSREVKSVEETSLKAFFENLYVDRTFSDINLKVGTENFPVHRVVLGFKSPMFKTMFTSDLTNKNFELPDLDTDTLLQLLGFIYTDTIDKLSWDSARKLYLAAKEYQMPSLKQKCCIFLKEIVDLSNACSTLLFANENQDEELAEFAQAFISDHGTELIHSDEWEELQKKNFQLAFQTLQSMYLKKVEQKT
ncbi:TD and POZ domain-containing protein 4 [Nephila pilipes]|uniref:TD and POZ domain-containing protein 4 n=1 Tax=Nephila pilipes TaxID=299642 RepID=A0A8X6R1Y0_NEPPI|nr:TD and POZ domain-containing protein 4 [Nephila pilipes]